MDSMPTEIRELILDFVDSFEMQDRLKEINYNIRKGLQALVLIDEQHRILDGGYDGANSFTSCMRYFIIRRIKRRKYLLYNHSG